MYKKFNMIFDPIPILKNLRTEEYLVCLDSQNDDRTLSRYTIISCNPIEIVTSSNKSIEQIFKRFDTLKNKLAENQALPFNGGFIGALSYHLLEDIYNIKLAHQHQLPKIIGGIYEQAIIIDYELEQTHLFNLNGPVDLLEQALYRADEPSLDIAVNSNLLLEISDQEYDSQFAKTKDYIASGDVYEINFTGNYKGTSNIDSLTLFERLRANNPAPYAAFCSYDDLSIVSASPELFFELKDGMIRTQPMKGTAARTNDSQVNQINLAKLRSSKKERAELTMIIDLMRNDLSKLCTIDSVRVENPFLIKNYPTVFQQVADVCGTLKSDVSYSDIIKALFPSGSITGAPKLRSIEVIDELENYAREYYTGSLGYFSYNQNACFNVAIRTVIKDRQAINFSVGSAIVWDSTSEGEFEELKLKAKGIYDCTN